MGSVRVRFSYSSFRVRFASVFTRVTLWVSAVFAVERWLANCLSICLSVCHTPVLCLLLLLYYYYYYYYKCTDYSDDSQSCRGTLHIRFKKKTMAVVRSQLYDS